MQGCESESGWRFLFLLKLRTSSHEALKYEGKSWVAVFSHPTCISVAEEPWAPAAPEPPTPTGAHGTSRPEGPALSATCLLDSTPRSPGHENSCRCI